MITASFGHASERFVGDLCVHFLPLFQQVVVISKTCNQLYVSAHSSNPTAFVERIPPNFAGNVKALHTGIGNHLFAIQMHVCLSSHVLAIIHLPLTAETIH
jgi:hypothetical protein